MLRKANVGLGQDKLLTRAILHVLEAAKDLHQLRGGLQSLPDMRVLAVGLLPAGIEQVQELD